MTDTRKDQAVELSVVIPAFNEAANIETAVRESLAMARQVVESSEVVVVDDGSTDDTGAILARLQRELPALVVERHEENRGIGEALLTLYRVSRGDRVVLLPADLQVRAEVVPDLLNAARDGAVVAGYRFHRQDPWFRRMASRMYRWSLRLVFGLRVRDADCVKCYPGEWLRSLELLTNSVFVEAEILIQAVEQGRPIEEVPVPHYPRTSGCQTGVASHVVMRGMKEFWWFWWAYHFGGDREQRTVDRPSPSS